MTGLRTYTADSGTTYTLTFEGNPGKPYYSGDGTGPLTQDAPEDFDCVSVEPDYTEDWQEIEDVINRTRSAGVDWDWDE